MAIFKSINKKKGCKLKYTSQEILGAYSIPKKLETIANQVVIDLFQCIYFKKQVSWMVTNKGGKLEDVEDFIQESLFLLKKNLLRKAYKGGDITAFTIGIAKYSWLNIIKKKKQSPMIAIDDDEKSDFVLSNVKDASPNQEEWRIIQEEEKWRNNKLSMILKDCLSEKQINLLSLKYIQRLSYEEIVQQLTYKSADAAKGAAMDARKKLKKCMHANPSYTELLAAFV